VYSRNKEGTMVTKATHPVAPDFSHVIPEIADSFQRIVDTYLDKYDEHDAFSYLIAELFETTDEDRFVFTDGPKDGGIDFIVSDPPAYTIAQCKCADLTTLLQDPSIPKFDSVPLEELSAAIHMLLDRSGEYEIKPEVRRLRGDYQRDLSVDAEYTSLTAILAVLGELTEPARMSFISQKNQLASQGVDLKLIEWQDIYQAVHALETPADIDFEIQLSFTEDDDLLSHTNYCYFLANAHDFYEAFRKHEWNLFEWNVRYQLHRSPINRRIVATLRRAKGRRFFHHYNNGLLITCRSYRIDRTRKRLTLLGPQVINGCQTVRAICEAYDSLTPSEQEHFRDETKVQVKVLQTTDPEFIAGLVVSTNDQNPMRPRNLKSNSSEQRSLQRGFRALPKKWFYQRKDGEFESLLAIGGRVRWFRKSDYAATRNRFRLIDNQELAKTWYAFIGHSNRALRGGIDYFEDEPDGVYGRIFLSVPSPAFWSSFAEPTFEPQQSFFEHQIPSVHQFLLAMSIAKYVDGRRISYRSNRQSAILRGIRSGALRGDPDTGHLRSTARETDEYLQSDIEYNLCIMINNMREIIIELYSFLLCRRYRSCDAITSQALLTQFPGEKLFLEKGFHESQHISTRQDGNGFIGSIYEFILDTTKQYYFEYDAEIKAAPRLKSYLAQRSTVNRFRDALLRRNRVIPEYDVPWKVRGKTFLDSLPSLE
jgi:hypothetical protein